MRQVLLILTLLVLGSASIRAQEISEVSNHQYNLERIAEIDKSVKKLERNIKHEDRVAKRTQSEKRVKERELEMLRERQVNNRDMRADILASMNGLNLEALEDKIKMLSRDNRKLHRDNSRKAKSIARKRAQIEKLEQQIVVLEEGISNNEDQIDLKNDEIGDTREIIVENALEPKTERLDELAKDYKKLEEEEDKLRMKLGKLGDNIIRSRTEKEIAQQEVQFLKEERNRIQKAMRGSNDEVRSY